MNLREGNQVFFPLHPSSKFGLKKHCFLLTHKFGVFDARHVASVTSLNCPDKLWRTKKLWKTFKIIFMETFIIGNSWLQHSNIVSNYLFNVKQKPFSLDMYFQANLNAFNPTPDTFLQDNRRSVSSTVIDSSTCGKQTNCTLNDPDFAQSFHVAPVNL